MSMTWKRNDRGGYVGTDLDRDASAVVGRASKTYRGTWYVQTYLFGERIDARYFTRLADAKWHAIELAQLADVHGVEVALEEIDNHSASTNVADEKPDFSGYTTFTDPYAEES